MRASLPGARPRARLAWALVLALPFGGGDQDKGVQLFGEGKYAEAATAFRAAIENEGPSAELSYDLALALWRAGQLDEAETAVEQAATLSGGALNALRDGLLGNLRFDKARAAAEADPKAALPLAEQARDHYLRGATAGGGPELTRNLERALSLIDDLNKKIEEQKKQEQQQQDQKDQQDKKDDKEQKDKEQKDQNDQKGDKDKPDEQKQQDEQKDKDKQGQQQPQDQQQGEEKEPPEPKPEEKPKDKSESKPEEKKPQEGNKDEKKQGAAGQEQPPAPGEQDLDKQLTPEQKQRLLEKLEQLDAQLRELRKAQAARRPKVEKDW